MSGLYLHIPFCDTKCIYCDFYSITNHTRKAEFIDCLIKEIKSYSSAVQNKTFDTIFFGGGTPSLLEYDDFARIFEALQSHYTISKDSEITIEANPGTLNKTKLAEFKRLPINRMSFGVQSFIDSELQFLTRIHSAQQAISAIKSAQDAGFENLNLDLIFALPKQSKTNWQYNLNKAIELDTKHISAYSLIFEEGTFLNTLLHRNKVKKADIDLEQEMYEFTMEFLPKAGFNQYEISNYARSGFECRHNLKYWEYDDYISFGPSASSFLEGKRWTNVKDINKYISAIDDKKSAIDFEENIDSETSMMEFIFLSLRSKGIVLDKFYKRFGEEFTKHFSDQIKTLIDNGFAELNENKFYLTRKGYAVCDEIVATYF